jgi:YD repeat-containing protein
VSDPDTVWLFTYNENGKVTEPTDVEGKVIRTNYHRDQQGRKIAVKAFLLKSSSNIEVVWAPIRVGMQPRVA